MKSQLLGVMCIAVLCVVLTLGLWPFHSPRNDVAWLKQTGGLAFGRYGTVLSRASLKMAHSQRHEGCSIEIWAQPDHWSSSATILALYSPETGRLFTLRQSLSDLELQAEVRNAPEAAKTHFYVDDAFGPALQQKRLVVISVTSGEQGTMVYLDGVPVKAAPRFRIPEDSFPGRLILGDSPGQPDSFRGQIRGLAIYNTELNREQVSRHYRAWTQAGQPDAAQVEGAIALYLFNEKTGSRIHNHAAGGGDLLIPDRYTVVDKVSLESFWKEFNSSGGYWRGNLKNVVGFIPLGFCFCAYFTVVRPIKRAVPVTVVLGALVSLTIEVLQTFLPTRDSGTTDLITNTFGTYVGVLCCTNIYPALVERFPTLGWFLASPGDVTEASPGSNSKRPTHCSS